MSQIFSKLDFVCVYLDDILIFSNSLDQHKDHVRQVLEVLRQNQLCAKLAKCLFAQSSMEFLGHELSHGQVKIDPRRQRQY